MTEEEFEFWQKAYLATLTGRAMVEDGTIATNRAAKATAVND